MMYAFYLSNLLYHLFKALSLLNLELNIFKLKYYLIMLSFDEYGECMYYFELYN